MKYQFYTCDVFTDTRFGGNPLAVLPNAEGLSTKQMQQIAREFNYSESAFVFPSTKGHTRNIRIFTPSQEIPFAGHPNIGTAFTLATIGQLADFGTLNEAINIIFEEKIGLVPIQIRKVGASICCELKAPEALSIGQTLPVELVASALSLVPEDIVTRVHQPQVASVGLPFILVELKDRTALENACPYMPAIEAIHAKGIMPDIHAYMHVQQEFRSDELDNGKVTNGDFSNGGGNNGGLNKAELNNGGFTLRTRMFAPLDGIPEDPATGSANCALAAMLTHYSAESEGNFSWRIAQGIEMNRPSVLDARTQKRAAKVTGVWIAGTCVMVSEGQIELS